MKPIRIAAYLAACVATAASLLGYMDYVYMLGFPDGRVTDLGRAERRLAYAFIAVSVAAASCFIYLGAAAARRPVARKLSAAALLYLLSAVGALVIDYYYRLHLDDGAGG